MGGLRVEPEARRGAEIARQPQGSIGADLTPAAHNIVDPVRRHLDLPRELVAAEAERLHELLEKNLSGRRPDAHDLTLLQ